MTSEFFEKLVADAKVMGFSECEAYYTKSCEFSAYVFGGKLSQYVNNEVAGLSFRGKINGKLGYSYTETLTNESIPLLLQFAKENATIIEEEIDEELYAGESSYLDVKTYDESLNKYSSKEKVEMAFELERKAKAYDERIKTVDYCLLNTFEAEVVIKNTKGLSVSQKSNGAYAYVSAVAEQNGETKTGDYLWHSTNLDSLAADNIGEKAAKNALANLGAKSIASRSCPVIFDAKAAKNLFGVFVSIFFAENAQKGFSMLNGKEGEIIASEIFNIKDDCSLDFGKSFALGNTSFDSEGVACTNRFVVENGKLNTLLYNLKSAKKAGKASTGNGFKASFRSPVSTAGTNFYIVPTNNDANKLYELCGNGILITDVEGLHSGTNAVSGDFSVSASGFLIENGVKSRPVEQITVAGNIYTMLKDIKAIGNDLYFSVPSSSGNIGAPSLLVGELSIAGE